MTTKKQMTAKEATRILLRAEKINPKPTVKILGQDCQLKCVELDPGRIDDEVWIVEFEHEYIKLNLKFILSSDIIDQLKYIVDNTPDYIRLINKYMKTNYNERPLLNFINNKVRIKEFHKNPNDDNKSEIKFQVFPSKLIISTTLLEVTTNTDIMKQLDKMNRDVNDVFSKEEELQ